MNQYKDQFRKFSKRNHDTEFLNQILTLYLFIYLSMILHDGM